jgi:riboflavin kinase/FMN adenylyltransferase
LEGAFERAAQLLGRPFSLYGTVVPGDGRGRRLGYPTANLDLHNETIPPDGVYACWALMDECRLPAVTSIGCRGTFHHEPAPERVVETHLIGHEGDLYGRHLEVQFVGLLRAQVAFAGADELEAQIERDVRSALDMTRGTEDNG